MIVQLVGQKHSSKIWSRENRPMDKRIASVA